MSEFITNRPSPEVALPSIANGTRGRLPETSSYSSAPDISGTETNTDTLQNNDNLDSNPLSQKTFTRRTFNMSALAAVISGGHILGRSTEAHAASGDDEINIDPSDFYNDFEIFKKDGEIDQRAQIRRTEANMREYEKLEPGVLHAIMNKTGALVKNPNWGSVPGPLLALNADTIPQFTLVNPDNNKIPFPNMGVDAFTEKGGGGSYITMTGLPIGRVTRQIAELEGINLDIAFTLRFLGGSKDHEPLLIKEPSFYTWRADSGISSYAGLELVNGHHTNPQKVTRAGDTDGSSLIEQTDLMIGSHTFQNIVGGTFAPIDGTQIAIERGWPAELYDYTSGVAVDTVADEHAEIYKLATLAKAHKEGFQMKVWDGASFTSLPIDSYYGDIAGIDPEEILKTLPQMEEFLIPEEISLEDVRRLLRINSVAASPFTVRP